MHPTLFHIFSFPVPSYGTMLAISFLTGIFVARHIAKKRGLDPDVIYDLGLYVIIAAIVGARAYYVMTHFDEFRGNLLSIVNPINNGQIGINGLVMYGGFIAAIITAAAYFKIKKLATLTYLDTCSTGVGFGIAITRIGCLMNGCCYGMATNAAYWLQYPNNGSPASYYQRNHAMHTGLNIDCSGSFGHTLLPSQLFESAGGIAIATIVILAGRSKRYFAGLQIYLLIALYAALRYFIEMTRYIETTKIGPFSHNQIICMVTFVIFGALIVRGLIRGNTRGEDNGTGNGNAAAKKSGKKARK
ncbi:MAG: prolipoprotein diacylglyceryl transferase [Chitinispirillia bacterium]|nr:prolipoprotein diacylglyceryl transferase [Chitinispirillia bacterium]MCL2269418.1 prolipoprotein diacylglyceryl transferase [Chitinispirillia bacterium]